MVKGMGTIAAVLASFSLLNMHTDAQELPKLEEQESCTTGATDKDGRRQSCHFLLELDETKK